MLRCGSRRKVVGFVLARPPISWTPDQVRRGRMGVGEWLITEADWNAAQWRTALWSTPALNTHPFRPPQSAVPAPEPGSM